MEEVRTVSAQMAFEITALHAAITSSGSGRIQ
jgi:hypothetical protein